MMLIKLTIPIYAISHKKRRRLEPKSDKEHNEGMKTYKCIDNSNESIARAPNRED